MAGHLDPDALADFREGLLGRRRSARIRAHLGTCPTCASLDKDLAQVTELLASAPAPKMPDHLVTRLENALAAEAAARTANQDLTGHDTEPADAAPDTAGGAHRSSRRIRRSWQLRPATLGVAAAVAAILAVGGYGLTRLHPGPGTSASSSGVNAPAHRPGLTLGPRNPTGLPDEGLAGPSNGVVGQLRIIESGTDYLPSRLASQAQAVLAGHSINHLSGRDLVTASPPGSKAAEPAAASKIPSCVPFITGGLGPLLIDQARYQGQPATIIILPAAKGRAGQVWVTKPNCTATNRDLIAHTQFTG